MGVYIPNMSKPKDCSNCSFYDSEYPWACEPLQNVDGYECPMVEIDLVRCGECKYMRKYALRSDEPTGIWCHRWSVPRLVTDDDFCSYGERRADEK